LYPLSSICNLPLSVFSQVKVNTGTDKNSAALATTLTLLAGVKVRASTLSMMDATWLPPLQRLGRRADAGNDDDDGSGDGGDDDDEGDDVNNGDVEEDESGKNGAVT
jgi:hypothetical protein